MHAAYYIHLTLLFYSIVSHSTVAMVINDSTQLYAGSYILNYILIILCI